MIYTILSLVIASLSFVVYRLIKSNNSLRFKNNYMEDELSRFGKMEKSYKIMITEKATREGKSEKFIEKVNNSNGFELLDIVNSL